MTGEIWGEKKERKKKAMKSNNMQEHLVITMRWHFTEPRQYLNSVSVS